MDDGDDMELDGVTSKRACDSCRTRKIRCDRGIPCSNCKASKLNCTTTAPSQKAQRQRVHISEEYEKKIDRIEDRLAGIENVLESLAAKLGDLDLRKDAAESSSQSRSSRRGIARSPGGPLMEASTPAPFEGETAMDSQSGYVKEFLARAVGSTPSVGQNAEVKSALLALNDLVTRQDQVSAPLTSSSHALINRALADLDPEKLDKPPWQAVSDMVDEACKIPTMVLAMIFPFLKMKNLKAILEDAYYNPNQCGASRRLLAYGVMNSLFQEYATFPLEGTIPMPTLYRTYIAQCKIQIEVAMSQLDIFIPANYENIMALLLGGACAIELCKPSVCSVLISTAAGLAMDLGYHRYQTMKDDSKEDRETKIYIFWMIYFFDKSMSLRLGRASFIQDFDISLSNPDDTHMLNYWIKVARVQGETYKSLYSPAAFLKSPEERTRIANSLVNELNRAWHERGDARATDVATAPGVSPQRVFIGNSTPNETELPSKRKRSREQPFSKAIEVNEYMRNTLERVEDVFFHSDVVMHYSTCSLIQRAVSPDNVTFDQETLESSRAALVAHMRCNVQFNIEGNEDLWNGYIHWSILQAPFTPFIVIFCNAVQNADPTDLPSLQDFVTSLESCRTLSEGADKLYKMCHLFLRVAKLYLQAKLQDNTYQSQSYPPTQPNYYTAADGSQVDLNSMTQFDPYLSALGLMPNSAWPMANVLNPQGSDDLHAYTQGQSTGAFVGPDMTGMGITGGAQNSVQDWFSGSRYLMNLLEAGDDSQMPDLDF